MPWNVDTGMWYVQRCEEMNSATGKTLCQKHIFKQFSILAQNFLGFIQFRVTMSSNTYYKGEQTILLTLKIPQIKSRFDFTINHKK